VKWVKYRVTSMDVGLRLSGIKAIRHQGTPNQQHSDLDERGLLHLSSIIREHSAELESTMYGTKYGTMYLVMHNSTASSGSPRKGDSHSHGQC
jgi:hypothetical protein